MTTFADALRGHMDKDVFIFVSLRDSTGRMGRVVEVGDDYIGIIGSNQLYYIPFSAILAVTPKSE